MGSVGRDGLPGPQLSSSRSFTLPLALLTRWLAILPVAPGMPVERGWRGQHESITRAPGAGYHYAHSKGTINIMAEFMCSAGMGEPSSHQVPADG